MEIPALDTFVTEVVNFVFTLNEEQDIVDMLTNAQTAP